MLPLGILTAATHEADPDLSPHHGVLIIPTVGCPLREFCAMSSTDQAGTWDTHASAALVVPGFSAVESCAAFNCWQPHLTDLSQTCTFPIPFLRLDIKKYSFSGGCGEAQDQVTKRCCRCPIAKNIQSQVVPALSHLI